VIVLIKGQGTLLCHCEEATRTGSNYQISRMIVKTSGLNALYAYGSFARTMLETMLLHSAVHVYASQI
jgi:hypothetical protein